MAKATTNQKEFEKQIRKFNRLINKVESEGLVFIERPIEPIKPKRISKKYLRELEERNTLPKMRAQAYELDQQTGELTPYQEPKIVSPRKRGTSFEPLTGRQLKMDIDEPRVRTPRQKKPKITTPKSTFTREPAEEDTEDSGLPTGNLKLQRHYKYTPEELHDIRSQAGKKAQETIRRRMAEDPDYAKRMHDIRSRAGKKAQEAIKRKRLEDPDYDKRFRERRKRKPEEPEVFNYPEDTPDARRARRKRREIEKLKQQETYTPASGADTIIENLEEILSQGDNSRVCDYLLDLLHHQYSDEKSKRDFALYLSTVSYWALDLASKVAFASSQESARQNANTLADLITRGDYSEDELEDAVWFDWEGYKYKEK